MMNHLVRFNRVQVAALVLCLGFVTAPAAAEAPRARAAPPSQQRQEPKPAPVPAPVSSPQPVPEPPIGPPVNVRIELLLTDSAGDTVITQERLNAVVATGELARVRRENGLRPAATPSDNKGFRPSVFNVDLTPDVVDRKIRLTLTMFYLGPSGPEGKGDGDIRVTENVRAFLDDGKPLVISEGQGDPVGNRRVTVRATATILD